MGQAQINVRTRACSRTSIARTKQAALTHNVRGKELMRLLMLVLGCSPVDASLEAPMCCPSGLWRETFPLSLLRRASHGSGVSGS